MTISNEAGAIAFEANPLIAAGLTVAIGRCYSAKKVLKLSDLLRDNDYAMYESKLHNLLSVLHNLLSDSRAQVGLG